MAKSKYGAFDPFGRLSGNRSTSTRSTAPKPAAVPKPDRVFTTRSTTPPSALRYTSPAPAPSQSVAPSASLDAIYQKLLGRKPDAGGRAFFAGQSESAIKNAIRSSAEYKSKSRGTTAPTPASIYDQTPKAAQTSTFDPYGYLSGKSSTPAAPAAPAFDMDALYAQIESANAANVAAMEQMAAEFQQQMQAQQQAMAQQQEEMLKQQQQYAQQMMINQAQSERDPADVRIGSNRRRDLARAGTAGYFGRGGMRLGSLNLGSGTGGPSRVPQASMNPTPKPNPFAFPKPTPRPNPFAFPKPTPRPNPFGSFA